MFYDSRILGGVFKGESTEQQEALPKNFLKVRRKDKVGNFAKKYVFLQVSFLMFLSSC